MKDNKASSLLLLVSLVLFLMSFVILCTWGYNAYYRPKHEKRTVTLEKDTAAIARTTRDIANATRDSLRKIYDLTILNLSRHFDSSLRFSDSVAIPLSKKLDDFFKLKDEVDILLKSKNNDADLAVAKSKIEELQHKVEDLTGRNIEVEQENKRLAAMLKQLQLTVQENRNNNSGSAQPANNNKAIPAVAVENANNRTTAAEKPATPENVFQVYDLRLSAMMETDNKELETYQAIETDKFIGSFIVKSSTTINNFAEMVIVIQQPDGKVLQKSSWESGTFEAPEGRKVYSLKMRFDYSRGEPKKLLFTIPGDKFEKGNYSMLVYYNGKLVGKMNKTLS